MPHAIVARQELIHNRMRTAISFRSRTEAETEVILKLSKNTAKGNTMKSILKSIRITAGVALLSATPLIAFAASGGGTRPVDGGSGGGAVSAVPEPGALLLFAAGAVVVGVALRRKRS